VRWNNDYNFEVGYWFERAFYVTFVSNCKLLRKITILGELSLPT